MRIIVMFDLPTINEKDLKNYRIFRKFLIKNGFMMMQESVYSKIALNQSMATLIANKVRENKPPKGLVLSLIHISEPTRQAEISYAVFCLKKKRQRKKKIKKNRMT